LALPETEEAMPYGEDWVVFRVGGKIFLHIWLEAPIPTIAVKLLLERGEELREEYNAFSPAYHLNKKHWNDIFIEGAFPNEKIENWIKESYDLVKRKLPKSIEMVAQ
jgi:cytoplasmic protein